MIAQKVFETIALIAGVALALSACLLGAYLVYSVTPQWLKTLLMGVFLLCMGGTLIAAMSQALTNKAIDDARERRQS